MKYVITTIVMFYSVSGALAQTNTSVNADRCRLSVAQSPAIRGLRLGMNVDQLLALFPGSSDDPTIKSALGNAPPAPNYGQIRLNLSPSNYSSPPQFSGVQIVGVDIFDGRIYRLIVEYIGTPDQYPWSHVDQFIEKMINTYKLPELAKWNQPGGNAVRVLECEGFKIKASISGSGPSIELQTPEPDREREARREAEMKKLRDAFVP